MSELCKCGECLECERSRREELEAVAAALYLGHDDAKEQFDMYRVVYLGYRPASLEIKRLEEIIKKAQNDHCGCLGGLLE